ncbi:uncharacterized protein LOC123004131 [Tribolium madens]|uniref:uncharacterized protein LOC123004131 n=1 Tax=Tribolium madens TaxID=41895 RepID=UPI001CF72A61|nr:uncharacterized protein LOC123004131 [Tribolium madens]
MSLLLLLLASLATSQAEIGCVLDILAKAPNAPLVVNSSFQYPTPISIHNTQIYFSQGEFFYIACPNGTSNYPIVGSGEVAICHHNSTISTLSSDLVVDFHEIECRQETRPNVLHYNTDTLCEHNFRLHNMDNVVFGTNLTSISMCFDYHYYVPLYSKYTTNQWLDNNPSYDPNVTFFNPSEVFQGKNLLEYEKTVKERMENLGFGDYITDNVTLILGHLADPSEFLTSFERDLTFDTSNAVFRWNTIDQGNWKKIRLAMQELITHGGDYGDVIMLTGALNVATLVGKKLFLDTLFKAIPVPQWIWKLMYSKTTKFGIIFFVYNNPWNKKSQADSEFESVCENVFDSLNWVDRIDNEDAFAGYTYACTLDRNQIFDDTIDKIVQNVLK